jgi:hypothetical protein
MIALLEEKMPSKVKVTEEEFSLARRIKIMLIPLIFPSGCSGWKFSFQSKRVQTEQFFAII